MSSAVSKSWNTTAVPWSASWRIWTPLAGMSTTRAYMGLLLGSPCDEPTPSPLPCSSVEDPIGDFAEVGADQVGFRVDRVVWHARSSEERGAAAGCVCPGDVPGVGGDERHFAHGHSEGSRGKLVGLAARLERVHGIGGED